MLQLRTDRQTDRQTERQTDLADGRDAFIFEFALRSKGTPFAKDQISPLNHRHIQFDRLRDTLSWPQNAMVTPGCEECRMRSIKRDAMPDAGLSPPVSPSWSCAPRWRCLPIMATRFPRCGFCRFSWLSTLILSSLSLFPVYLKILQDT